MSKRIFPWLAMGTLIAAATPVFLSPARAQAVPRELFDFEADLQGFTAIQVKDGNFNPDPNGGLSVVTAKDQVKSGSGTLSWSHKAEPGTFRALVVEAKLPANAARLEFWVKSSAQTVLTFTAREADGSSYHLACHVPAHEWTRVSANLDELTLGDNETDENGKLDLDQVNSIGIFDLTTMLVQSPELGSRPELRTPRTLWLDDLRFSPERAPQAFGVAREGDKSSFVVDNFEGDAVRWLPVRLVIAQPPSIEIFPGNTSLKLQKEAAGPGMARTPTEAGGRGLRFTYPRAAMEVFALIRSLERADLSKAERLRMSLRMSQKSLVIVGVKEKDGSEYNHTIAPDQSEGWQSLDLALSDFSLGGESKDENNALDPGQIKEISIVDASAFAGTLGNGETSIEIDAVSFALK